MIIKHRLVSKGGLLVYCLAGGVLVFIFLVFSSEWAIILSPVLPLYLLAKNVKRVDSIFDFRLVYLLSISVWSFGKSLSLGAMGFGYSESAGPSLNVYMAGMVLAPALAFLFEYSDFGKRKSSDPMKVGRLLLLATIWGATVWLVNIALVGGLGESVSFVVLHVFQGFALVLASVLLLEARSFGPVRGGVIVFVVYIVTILAYSEGEANRTTLLLPIGVLTGSLLFGSAVAKTSVWSPKFGIFSFVTIPLLAFALIVADIQKQEAMQLEETINLIERNPAVMWASLKSSNYLPSEGSAVVYFESLSAILEDGQEIPGGIFFQLASSLTPRLFFPNKDDTDLALIMWGKGYTPQPLYYEIFFEPIADSGIVGIVVYFFLFLASVYLSWRSVAKHRDGLLGRYCRSVYLLNLVVLFMVIRGPVIFVVWYAALPNALCYLLIVRTRHRLMARRSRVGTTNLPNTGLHNHPRLTNDALNNVPGRTLA